MFSDGEALLDALEPPKKPEEPQSLSAYINGGT